MKRIYVTLTLLVLAAITTPLAAQQFNELNGPCGTSGKSEWLTQFQRSGGLRTFEKSLNIQYLPMNVVFVGDDNGAGYIDPTAFLSSMELLNSDFRDMNIQFFISGDIKYVANSRWNEHTFTTGRELMSAHNVARRVNTYVVTDPAGACGYYTPSRDAIALGKNCLGRVDRTWSHEIGHYLSLPHTFYGWESVEEIANLEPNVPAPATLFYRGVDVPVELVDGSNCEDAADGFCDTEPDHLMQRWACNGDGFYRDSLLDPDSVRFAVPAYNIMSYANDGCVTGFTPDQQTAMLANLDSRLGLVDNSNVSLTPANVDDLVMISPEDGARLVYQDSVTLLWNSVPNADMYVVQFHNSSNFGGAVLNSFVTSDTSVTFLEGLVTRRNYYWRVRPVNRYQVAGDYGPIFRFRNGSRLTSTIDAELDAAITVAPNPVNGGQELRIFGRDLNVSGTLNYELVDAAGRILVQRNNVAVTAAGFNERLQTNELAAGIYFLRIQLDGKLVTRRVVVTP